MGARISEAGWTPACFAAHHVEMEPCRQCPIGDLCREAGDEGQRSLMVRRELMVLSACDIGVAFKELQQQVDEMKRRLK